MSTPAEQQVETEPKPVHQPEGDQPSNQELSASDELDESGDPLELVESRPENYPHGIKLILLLMSLYCALFLVALDRTIIATALPQITDEFHSFADVGWYNGAFAFPMTALQLFFGRLYTFYSPKWIFLTLVVIFEAGSALCGAAPNSMAFIWGRAIAGVGAGGLFNGTMILMMYAAPLEKRPMYMGLFGAVFGVASVAGPLLGGVFTTKVTWRWCFYINLPIGAVTLLFLVFALENTVPALGHLPFKEKFSRIDIPGTLIFIPTIVCLLLALQWGGQTYPWSDGRIIALLVLAGVLAIVFVLIQIWRQEAATIPPRIFKQRTIVAGFCYTFCVASGFLIIVYYISMWFQAIKGDSAVQSGISTIPLILSLVVASISSGIVVSRVGYYNPPILLSVVLTSVGAGIFTLFKTDTAHPMWIGIQVLFGFGLGLGMQQPNIAAQNVLAKKDAPTGISVVFFGQGIGGTLSVAIGQNVLDNKLIAGLSSVKGITAAEIVNTGATELRNAFPPSLLPQVLEVYNQSLVTVFYISVAFAVASLFPALAIEWKKIRKASPKKDAKPKDEEEPKEVSEEVPSEV